MWGRRLGTVTLIAAGALAPVVGAASTPPGDGSSAVGVFPGDEWETVTPEDAGLDAAVLDAIAADAEAAGSNCFLVARDGRLVAEWYWQGASADAAQEVFSVSKSVTSALVGIAAADTGNPDVDLELTDSAAAYIPEWSGTDAEAVTVEHLLSNDSGREWSFQIDYTDMAVNAEDKSAFAVALGQEFPPGETWAYNNAAIQTLSEVLQSATGIEPADFAEEHLFGPVGMAATDMTTDATGNTLTFMGVQSTCRDLARFGLLYLNDGSWDGTQIVPADYVEASVGAPSTELNAAYGYLWWLNREGPQRNPVGDPTEPGEHGQMVPGAPDDMFWAIGLGSQIVQVDPGSRTVVVRLGPFDLQPTFGAAATARVVTEGVVD